MFERLQCLYKAIHSDHFVQRLGQHMGNWNKIIYLYRFNDTSKSKELHSVFPLSCKCTQYTERGRSAVERLARLVRLNKYVSKG